MAPCRAALAALAATLATAGSAATPPLQKLADAKIGVADGEPSCGPPRLRSGGCVFVFAAADVDDPSQMVLLPHFVLHYAAMGLPPSRLLLLVHVRPPGGQAEAERAASWLRLTYGIRRVQLLVETGRDSAHRFLVASWTLLRDVVRDIDWVIHVELDELVVFPPEDYFRDGAWTDLEQPADVHAFFDARDAEKVCTIEGFVVDRMGPRGALAPLKDISQGSSIFEQFPLNCATGIMLRRADPRRTVAYRGFVRVGSGHHVAFALNREMNKSLFAGWIDYPSWFFAVGVNFRAKARRLLGKVLFELSPLSRQKFAPYVELWSRFASVFHFKWTAGLRARMELLRRQGWAASAQHEEWLSTDEGLAIGDISRLCREAPPGRLRSPLHTQEMQLLLQWTKGDEDEVVRRFAGPPTTAGSFDQRMVLYQIFHHGFPYGVHEDLSFVQNARLAEDERQQQP